MTHGDSTLDRINRFLDEERSTSSGESLLGRRALARGLITPEALCFCLEQQSAMRRRGEDILLGQLLVKQGLLSPENLTELLSEGAGPLPGLTRYDVLAMLGEGATAVVFRAWDRELHRPVAIKVLRKALSGNAQLRQRFNREARIAAGLSHPNLIAVYDAGETDGQLYLVMQVVEGRPLSAVLPELRTDRPALLRLLAKAARGVGAAHRQEIVHRDLKPANILVTAGGEPKVGDFGLAHWEQDEAALTQTGATLGTPLYMAPEQIRGDPRAITPRTDVYAFGTILYEAMAGRPPHIGVTIAEIYERVAHDQPASFRSIGAEVPADIETIVFKAMEKPPERRYANADEFADDLERYLRAEPIRARRYTLTQRVARVVWQRRVPVASALLALVAAFAAYAIVGRITRASRLRELLTRGVEMERLGRLDEARDTFRSAIDLAPEDPEAKAGAARAEERAERRRRAGRTFEEAGYALERVTALLYRADSDPAEILRQAGAAIETIERAMADWPDSVQGLFQRGRAHELLGASDRAEGDWRAAIRLDGSFAPAHLELGRLLLERSALADSQTSFETRWIADRVLPRTRELAEEAKREIETAASLGGLDDPMRRTIAEAQAQWAANDKEKASRLLDDAIARHGRVAGVEDLYWLRGLILKKQEAVDSFTRALEIRPKHAMVLFARATEYDDAGKDVEAIADYSEALRLRPRFFAARLNRGAVHAKSKQWREAIADFTAALEISPKHAETLFNRGMCHENLREYEIALADFSAALDVAPGFVYARFRRASALGGLGRIEEAYSECGEALRQDPNLHEAFCFMAKLHIERGECKEAVALATRGLEKHPDDVELHLTRTNAYIELRDADGAIAGLTDLIRLRPEGWHFLLRRGTLRAMKGQKAEARADFEKALELAQAPEDRASIQKELRKLGE